MALRQFGIKRKTFFVFLILGSCFLTAEPQPFVRLEGKFEPSGLSQGYKGNWTILVKIAPGIHLSDAASGLFAVHPQPAEYITFGSPIYPKGIKTPFGSIYRGKVSVIIPISLHASIPRREQMFTAEVRIQPCGEKDGICYPPETMHVSTKLVILAGSEQSVPTQYETGPDEGMAGRLSSALERGSILAFFLVFLGGLLTSLTPCVYPMIPITLAVIGAHASGSRMKGFVLSLFYVLGIAITFSGLGIAAAKSGSLFGTVAQHSAVQVVLALVFFLMGLSLLGIFVVQMPASLAGKIRGKKRTGYLGVILTGLLAGLMVSPCISPILVVILAWVAKTGNALLGFGLLFSFALGLGVLFVLIGTFSGVLKNLPKAGVWTEHIERVFGMLLVGLSIHFLKNVAGPFVYQMLWAAFFLFLGVFIGGLSPLDRSADRKSKIGKAAGFLAVLVSACLVFFSFSKLFEGNGGEATALPTVERNFSNWIFSDEEGFSLARNSGRLLLMDVYAEWCAACRELDEKTWPNDSLNRMMSRFILVKLDLTKSGDGTTALQKKYAIVGMPTVILFRSDGRELDRFTGFKAPAEVLEWLRRHAEAN